MSFSAQNDKTSGDYVEKSSQQPSFNFNELPTLKKPRIAGSEKESNSKSSASPSKVIHIRNLVENITENEIIRSLEKFGLIRQIFLMEKKRQALVEFAEITSSINCVNSSNRSNLFIRDSPVYLNYSNNQKLVNPGQEEGKEPEKVEKQIGKHQEIKENHILLFDILNPLYPITVEIMHTICSPFGKVLKIIIFRKNGVQAMIEYSDSLSASKSKQALDGADIYSGCCTLKIDYAKVSHLNVLKNDQDSWDYSLINLKNSNGETKKQPLLQNPSYGNGKPTPFNNGQINLNANEYEQSLMSQSYESLNRNNPNGHSRDNNLMHQSFSRISSMSPSLNSNMNSNNQMRTISSQSNDTNYSNLSQQREIPSLMSPIDEVSYHLNDRLDQSYIYNPGQSNQIVLTISNLCTKKFNCDRLFNLFCLYGNVDKVKFLMSKPDTCMMQMSNAEPLFDVLAHLNNTYIFGKKIQIYVSKQTVLNAVPKPINLSDGTISYKEYLNNRNNRYQTIEAAQKNKPLAPSNVLHWYNSPPGFTEEQVLEIFANTGAKLPAKIKVFPKKSEKSTTGLVEWNNIAECVEGLVLANHFIINHSSSKFPYIFKLCFSSTPIMD